ncbi:MAG: heavy-metal-associated domain-containing protein, partial [Marinobacter sp.]
MNDAPLLHTSLSISGATCQGCAKRIRNALEPLTGDTDLVEVNLDDQTVALPEGIDTTKAARIVTEAGYPAEPVADSVTEKPASCCSPKSQKPDSEPDAGEQATASENKPEKPATPAQSDDQV